MDGYPDISDHGLISDMQTAALVATDGVLAWFCCPRLGSPSVFASLLEQVATLYQALRCSRRRGFN